MMTLRKLKTVMPSIKPPVEKALQSGVVYKLLCPGCQACYVGQTIRHLQSRFREHQRPSAAMTQHLVKCESELTLEAIWIRELAPSINTKDEFRLRELTVRW